MRNIERACARIITEGQTRAALRLRYGRDEAEAFVATVLAEEGVHPWPPYALNDEIAFYAEQLILESHRPARN